MVYMRRQTRPKPLKSELKSWGAPVGGWVSNRSLANPFEPGVKQGAAILDNYFPTSSTVRLRRGRETHVTLPTDPTAIFSYNNGLNEKLFTATASDIYDTTTQTPASVVFGQNGGDWSVVQFATTGNVYLIGVNGTDPGFIYDGSTFAALSVTFSGGVTSDDMSHVWVYKNRLWFVQKDSMDAWYLPVDSIAGAATLFPLAGVFGKGGSLLFGQTWSLDSGAEGGLSEQNVFCSTEGEVAIYQGVDPASATDWQKVGVYRIGTPLGKNAFIRGGGDLAIATSVGLVPLSKAITLDVTALSVATISYNIADAWTEAVSQRGLTGWSCEIWPEQKMAFTSPPDLVGSTNPIALVTNTETGAWCRFTNWRMLCMEVFQGEMYFGSPGGKVYKANKTGADDGMPYTGVVMPLYEDMGSPASLKVGKIGRAVIRALGPLNPSTVMSVDFDMILPTPPDATGFDANNLWGTGEWGNSTWGSLVPDQLDQRWVSLGGSGYAFTLASQITSGSVGPLDAELIRFDCTFTTATVVS